LILRSELSTDGRSEAAAFDEVPSFLLNPVSLPDSVPLPYNMEGIKDIGILFNTFKVALWYSKKYFMTVENFFPSIQSGSKGTLEIISFSSPQTP